MQSVLKAESQSTITLTEDCLRSKAEKIFDALMEVDLKGQTTVADVEWNEMSATA